MLLLVFKKGEKKVLEKHWVCAHHSALPPSGGSSVPTGQTGNDTNTLQLMHFQFPWGGVLS